MSVGKNAQSVYQAPGQENFRNRPRGRFGIYSGFTLVELLMVIAIVAVLAAILFPAFAGSKEAAKQANCLANLKQLASAWQLYADNYSGRACPSYLVQNHMMLSWDFSATTSGWKLGLLGPYTKNGAIFSCPSFDYPVDYDATYDRPYTGYAYNATYIGGDTNLNNGQPYIDPVTKKQRLPCLLQQIRQPAKTVIFADGGYDSPVVPQNYLRAPSDARFPQGTVHFRHNGRAGVAWADCHVSASSNNVRIFTNSHYHPANRLCGGLSADDSAYDLN